MDLFMLIIASTVAFFLGGIATMQSNRIAADRVHKAISFCEDHGGLSFLNGFQAECKDNQKFPL